MSNESITRACKPTRTHVNSLCSDGDIPFLARFAEFGDHRSLTGGYDEGSDVWIVDGDPVARKVTAFVDTMTFTNSGGESQDRD